MKRIKTLKLFLRKKIIKLFAMCSTSSILLVRETNKRTRNIRKQRKWKFHKYFYVEKLKISGEVRIKNSCNTASLEFKLSKI